jgi:hypothetical protein
MKHPERVENYLEHIALAIERLTRIDGGMVSYIIIAATDADMERRDINGDLPDKTASRLHGACVIRLPGFLVEEEMGLGDAIKRVTYALGVTACDGCGKRAEALNRWIRFSR